MEIMLTKEFNGIKAGEVLMIAEHYAKEIVEAGYAAYISETKTKQAKSKK